jgi:NDP-sugar pyrophosphorylase family protein
MNNDIKISADLGVGMGFVPAQYLAPGEDEYRIRNVQFRDEGKDPAAYRRLSTFELETLVRQNNTCSDWSEIFVADPFTPELIHNTYFSGFVRIGKLQRVSLEHHDLQLAAGISNSRIIACDIGDDCVISNCAYIAHYIIGDHCILIDNAEIHVSNHSKFGSGNIVEGEGEDVRITIDVMNESGGRAIYPFEGMTCADAYLWARYRDRADLMREFRRMTGDGFDPRRGRYGSIGAGSVLKSNGVIKDVAIGVSAYIKGANKLKNLMIRSREMARTQIGEGVEMVNGIVGFGCKIFYGCKAVRFVMCDNSALKYGARLIHSVLGENSTVSCCEILNNLIFPFHEQHHNTSFLIASLVKGQSNMAAGATIGSNHNSRAPDGEIEAGRGFWPGLSTSVKHSSRFASFCLLGKGSYRYELDIPFPFCLVDNDYRKDRLILLPAFWWISNMYALMRNEKKFRARDGRFDRSLSIEYSPFAPDTAEEILSAMDLLEKMTAQAFLAHRAAHPEDGWGAKWVSLAEGLAAGEDFTAPDDWAYTSGKSAAVRAKALAMARLGRAILAETEGRLPFEVLASHVERSDRVCVVCKPVQAWRAYRDMLVWFAAREVVSAAAARTVPPTWESLAEELAGELVVEETMPGGSGAGDAVFAACRDSEACSAGRGWENLGGLLTPRARLEALLAKAADGAYHTWDDLHADYTVLSEVYADDKLRYAWSLLGMLYTREDAAGEANAANAADAAGQGPSREGLLKALARLDELCGYVAREVYDSRVKDWNNPFRKRTFRNEAEMTAVMGDPKENSFIAETRREIEALRVVIAAQARTL